MTQKQRWVPLVTFIPLLYLMGWILAQPLHIGWNNIQQNQLSIVSTIFSFLLFIILLPSWAKARWKDEHFFATIGLDFYLKGEFIRNLFKGLFCSLVLLCAVLIPLILTPWGRWLGNFSIPIVLNGFVLGLFVGFAEETIFRGWLLNEMKQMLGVRLGLLAQAAIFSFVHLPFNLGLWPALGLLIGLFLLGTLLGLIVNNQSGKLWGCVGLHGGLVGGWFIISNGFVEISSHAPGWLFGPGGTTLNPIGGVLSIITLSSILYNQRTAFAIAGRPFKGACKASSKGALP
ncbi:MAG: type II CAAX endopeptidase family protein [Prochlorococcaceae cyanobacterium ETNP1_MAG_9]|nr:type II CAAX endopeptidase family protein [Prochlorococcaceae cyanobacterium ETNP1_MAG_9]